MRLREGACWHGDMGTWGDAEGEAGRRQVGARFIVHSCKGGRGGATPLPEAALRRPARSARSADPTRGMAVDERGMAGDEGLSGLSEVASKGSDRFSSPFDGDTEDALAVCEFGRELRFGEL